MRPSLRNANKTCRILPASFPAFPTPRGMIKSRCKQVSRLGFILLAHLPAFAVASSRAFVRFTVTGIARNFHPCSCGAFIRFTVTGIARNSHPCSCDAHLPKRAAHRCADTPAIHLSLLLYDPEDGTSIERCSSGSKKRRAGRNRPCGTYQRVYNRIKEAGPHDRRSRKGQRHED